MREIPPVTRMPPSYSFEVIAYGLLILGLFGFLWTYYDRRDRAYYDAERRKITFHCIRCDTLYTGKKGTELAACPKCGHQNTRLKF
jgi:ribosomal protein L37AE/L43A